MKRKVPVGISIPLELLEKIDQERGKKNRSEFVLESIKKALERETTEK
jgi:metal-responsive CopG/Arc/MetJ family transcriptional regulator